MRSRHHELYAISLLLVICAAVLLYRTFSLPSDEFSGEMQTAESTEAVTDFKSSFAVDINTANKDELLGVKGITENMADSIIAYREEHGRFTDISELLNVKGIGEKTYERIKPYVSV